MSGLNITSSAAIAQRFPFCIRLRHQNTPAAANALNTPATAMYRMYSPLSRSINTPESRGVPLGVRWELRPGVSGMELWERAESGRGEGRGIGSTGTPTPLLWAMEGSVVLSPPHSVSITAGTCWGLAGASISAATVSTGAAGSLRRSGGGTGGGPWTEASPDGSAAGARGAPGAEEGRSGGELCSGEVRGGDSESIRRAEAALTS